MRPVQLDERILLVTSNGKVYAFEEQSQLKLVKQLDLFERSYFGIFQRHGTILILGGGLRSQGSSWQLFDDIIQFDVNSGKQEALPFVLPSPLFLFSCGLMMVTKTHLKPQD